MCDILEITSENWQSFSDRMNEWADPLTSM